MPLVLDKDIIHWTMSFGTEQEETWDFFIARASADTAQALELHKALSQRAKVFLDKQSLRPGDIWAQVLPRALRQSRSILVMVSSCSQHAWYEDSEIRTAIDLIRANPEDHNVVPILLDQDGPIPRSQWPYGLEQIVPVSLHECGGWPQVADTLLDRGMPEAAPALLIDSTTGFVGETRFGPTRPQFVSSWEEFTRQFGDDCDTERTFLPYAVRGFFENGGELAVICRAISSSATGALIRVPTADSQQQLVVSARSPGSYGNAISVRVRAGTRTGVRITIRLGPKVEDFDNLSVGRGPNPLLDRVARCELARIEWSSPGAAGSMPNFGEWILSGGEDGAPTTARDVLGDALPSPEQRTGLAALAEFNEVALVCLPDAVHPRFSDAERHSLIEGITAHCERQTCFGILSAPLDCGGELLSAPVDSAAVGVYFPWIDVRAVGSSTAICVPASGHVSGAYARHDRECGLHVSPAGISLRGLSDTKGLTSRIDECTRRGVNQICSEESDASEALLASAVTTAIDKEWQPVQVRRFLNFFERSIQAGLTWTHFAPNDETTWSEVRKQIEAFLHRLWRAGVLVGDTADEAFFVRCDSSTVTEDDIKNGHLVPLIGFALADEKLKAPDRVTVKTLRETR